MRRTPGLSCSPRGGGRWSKCFLPSNLHLDGGDLEVSGGIDCLACISLRADSLIRRAFSHWLSKNLIDLKFPFCLCRSLPAVPGGDLECIFSFFLGVVSFPLAERDYCTN